MISKIMMIGMIRGADRGGLNRGRAGWHAPAYRGAGGCVIMIGAGGMPVAHSTLIRLLIALPNLALDCRCDASDSARYA